MNDARHKEHPGRSCPSDGGGFSRRAEIRKTFGQASVDRSTDEQVFEMCAQYCAAQELARQLAPLMGKTQIEVFEALTFIPEAMLLLLPFAEGWRLIAEHIAADLGIIPTGYTPTLH